MPSPDDFSVQIPVTADIDPVLREMDAATAKAAQKGQEAGQAYSQGVAMGAANGGVGGGINGPGVGGGGVGGVGGGFTAPTTGGAGGGPTVPPVAGGGGGTGAGGGGAAAGAVGAGGSNLIGQMAAFGADAAALEALTQAIKALIAIGGEIGKTLFEVTKRNLELGASMELLTAQVSRSNAINEQRFADATAGSMVDPTLNSRYQEASNRALDAELKAIEHEKGMGPAARADYGIASATGIVGVSDQYDMEQQAAELRGTADRLGEQVSGIARSRRKLRTGNIIAQAADAQGIPYDPAIVNAGETNSPVAAELMLNALKANAEATRALVETFRSVPGQQRFLREVTTAQGAN